MTITSIDYVWVSEFMILIKIDQMCVPLCICPNTQNADSNSVGNLAHRIKKRPGLKAALMTWLLIASVTLNKSLHFHELL